MSRIMETLLGLIAAKEVPGGAFCLFENGKILEKAAFGGIDGFGDLNIKTRVRIASISKLSTAICALKLWETGKIDLDVDISQYLGFKLRHPRFPDSPITARMILSHTSGLRDGSGYKGIIGERLASLLIEGEAGFNNGDHWAKLDAPFGVFCYSNLGMGVIAQMIENVSGKRFDVFATETIFTPLGLDCGFNYSGMSEDAVENTFPLFRAKGKSGAWEVQVDDNIKSKPRPTHFAKDGLGLKDYQIGSNGLVFSPQGGLRANVEDLASIAQVLMGETQILKTKTIEMMRETVWELSKTPIAEGGEDGSFLGFGTGIHILLPATNCPIENLKTPLYGHYGQAYGFLGGLWFEPKSQKGFAWFVIGSQYSPREGVRSGIYALEEEMMNAAASDLNLAQFQL